MTKYILGVLFLAFSSLANAILINGVNVVQNSQLFAGVSYEFSSNATNPALFAVGNTLQGIGSIDTIRDDQSNVIWSKGDNGVELNFVFDQYLISSITPFPGTLRYYQFVYGGARFYTNPVGTFTTGSPFATAVTGITSGALFLDTTAHIVAGDSLTAVSNVQASIPALEYSGSATGLLDILGGAASLIFDQDEFADNADMTFNASYQYIPNQQNYPLRGSVDFNTHAHLIPEPGILFNIGFGLLLLGLYSRSNKQKLIAIM
jgi:hypothetical protein